MPIPSHHGPARHVHSIVLVRHGRTSYNAAHRLQGQIDIPLDEVGEWQVRQTGDALADLFVRRCPDVPNQVVVASDLGRAAATAHAFADPLGLDVHLEPLVRERSFGQWEGVSVEELERRYPDDYRSWADFEGGELKYGAEEKRAVGARGVEAINDWAYRYGDDTNLFVFSHGAWISQTLQTFLGLSRIDADYSSIISMRNAHWARLVPFTKSDGMIRWRLVDYNVGPSVASTIAWEHPEIPGR